MSSASESNSDCSPGIVQATRGWRRRCVGGAVALTGLVLGFIALAGSLAPPAFPRGPLPDNELLDWDLVDRTQSLDDLFAAAQQESGSLLRDLPRAEAMLVLHNAVTRRMAHRDGPKHTVLSNWIIWTADKVIGRFVPEVGKVQDPNLVLKFGYTSLCGPQAYILTRLAMRAGIPARQVQLNLHYVMEAWYDDGWHMYDPDFEVIGGKSPLDTLSVRELVEDAELLRRIYHGKMKQELVDSVFQVESIEPAEEIWTPHHWKARALFRIESVCQVLKFVVPVLMLVIGVLMYRRRPATPDQANATGLG